ncbi:BRX1 Nucleolar protein involved in the assembly of the large ribosomal subunit [Apiospora arundinis]|uniref:Ribosome biogenesis protein BRX1 n=1 Tax=Apiospora arundinis TaxID=335852 RepID=A0ABR2IGD9_9PEZI
MGGAYKSLNGSEKADPASANGARKQKSRVLLVPSRGVTYRHRHLINDLANMLPHGKREVKWDQKSKLYELCELAEMSNCNNVIYFEARKGKDLYMWLSRVPNGPTVKMHLNNIHTMDELNFVGNALKGSRPILSFDAAFDKQPHLQVIKQLFLQTFGVPEGARKSKPFIDHVMAFTIADGKIWIRTYQINETEAKVKTGEDDETEKTSSKSRTTTKDTDINLLEMGPRFLASVIIIQEGSFGGPIIYENKEFVSPNQVRSDARRQQAGRHNARSEQFVERLAKKGDLGLRTHGGKKMPTDALDSRELFA